MKSSSRSKQKHLVQLKIPSCTWEGWQKSQYPCKHFFAVFKGYREWDFNVLPEDYKTTVFITLETEYLNVNFSDVEDAPLPTAQIEKKIPLKRQKMHLMKAARQNCRISRKLLRTSQKHKVMEEELKGLKLVSLPSARAQDLERTFKSN